jgi:phage internal scaffolding protein
VRKYGYGSPRYGNPIYGDIASAPDYEKGLNIVARAQSAFQALPAVIRQRFHNNPKEYLEFLSDEKNREEAERLRLIPKKPKPTSNPLDITGRTDTKKEKVSEKDGGSQLKKSESSERDGEG